MLSRVWVFANSAALQAPLSLESSRQGYWSGLPFPTPGDLPDPEIELVSSVLAVIFFLNTVSLGKPVLYLNIGKLKLIFKNLAFPLLAKRYQGT